MFRKESALPASSEIIRIWCLVHLTSLGLAQSMDQARVEEMVSPQEAVWIQSQRRSTVWGLNLIQGVQETRNWEAWLIDLKTTWTTSTITINMTTQLMTASTSAPTPKAQTTATLTCQPQWKPATSTPSAPPNKRASNKTVNWTSNPAETRPSYQTTPTSSTSPTTARECSPSISSRHPRTMTSTAT